MTAVSGASTTHAIPAGSLVHVAVTWDDDGGLTWSRSDEPGPRRWTGPAPATTADALDAVVKALNPRRVVVRQPGFTGGFALVEIA